MLVIDASAAIEILIESETGIRWRDKMLNSSESLCAPHLIDVEVMNGLRRLSATRTALAPAAGRAASLFVDLPILRFGHVPLLPRIWALRNNISAYDATYVALAEVLNVPLVTSDAKLAATRGHTAEMILMTQV